MHGDYYIRACPMVRRMGNHLKYILTLASNASYLVVSAVLIQQDRCVGFECMKLSTLWWKWSGLRTRARVVCIHALRHGSTTTMCTELNSRLWLIMPFWSNLALKWNSRVVKEDKCNSCKNSIWKSIIGARKIIQWPKLYLHFVQWVSECGTLKVKQEA